MKGSECSNPDGTVEKGTHEYHDEDIHGQAALTEAALDWLENDAKVHPTNLDASLTQFNVILGIYTSAIRRMPITLTVDPEPHLIDTLRAWLTG